MGAWLKIFYDGSMERGTDEDINKKLASWSKGRLDGIKEVRIFNKIRSASLSVQDTSWHQFDRFIAEVSPGATVASEVTHRVVQAEIKYHHVGQYLLCARTGINFFWAIVKPIKVEEVKNGVFHKQITKQHVGKWLTLVLPERDYPNINFSLKGKINDHKYIPKQYN